MRRYFGLVIAISIAVGVAVMVTRHRALVPALEASSASAMAAGQPNWCKDSARVSYGGYHSQDGSLMLEFSLSEPHKEKSRGILWNYNVNYTCQNGGSHTESGKVGLKLLEQGQDSRSADEEFIPGECVLPQPQRRINRVDITNINCN